MKEYIKTYRCYVLWEWKWVNKLSWGLEAFFNSVVIRFHVHNDVENEDDSLDYIKSYMFFN